MTQLPLREKDEFADLAAQRAKLADLAAQFAQRPASTNWEPLRCAESPSSFFWVWIKPPTVPDGFVIHIPEDVFRSQPDRGGPLTMRNLLTGAGVDPRSVSMWSLYGVPIESRQGTSPFLDQPIYPPVPGAEPNIVVHLGPLPGSTGMPAIEPAATRPLEAARSGSGPLGTGPFDGAPLHGRPFDGGPAVTTDAHLTKTFDDIEAAWYASLQVERQLVLMRKQLAGLMGRLKALDRDLSPEEHLHGDRQDRSDWQEVRRWLKDGVTKLSRYIKECDTGATSSAGKRDWFEQIYKQFIASRRPFEGLAEVEREFESHRKRLQTLLSNMNLAYTNAGQEAERRAQQVLGRLSAKVRGVRAKRQKPG